MKRWYHQKPLLRIVLVVLTGAAVGVELRAAGQDPAQGPAVAVPQVRQFRPRLPNYYSQVVNPKQRAAIYVIQRVYWPKIEALRVQMETLSQERDQRIEAVLTPPQRTKIAALRAAAKAKREQKRRGAKR